jgi:hypothetical protein
VSTTSETEARELALEAFHHPYAYAIRQDADHALAA